MKKSYSQYTAEDLAGLGLSVTMQRLFDEVTTDVAPTPWLLQTLAYNNTLPTSTEKARSELLIMPVLVELKQRNPEKIAIFSGHQFDFIQNLPELLGVWQTVIDSLCPSPLH